jgi:hypothetical protein
LGNRVHRFGAQFLGLRTATRVLEQIRLLDAARSEVREISRIERNPKRERQKMDDKKMKKSRDGNGNGH